MPERASTWYAHFSAERSHAEEPAVIKPQPYPPPSTQLTASDFNRIAEHVGRVIARRAAIERERRGR
jgi:hypothetical protein